MGPALNCSAKRSSMRSRSKECFDLRRVFYGLRFTSPIIRTYRLEPRASAFISAMESSGMSGLK